MAILAVPAAAAAAAAPLVASLRSNRVQQDGGRVTSAVVLPATSDSNFSLASLHHGRDIHQHRRPLFHISPSPTVRWLQVRGSQLQEKLRNRRNSEAQEVQCQSSRAQHPHCSTWRSRLQQRVSSSRSWLGSSSVMPSSLRRFNFTRRSLSKRPIFVWSFSSKHQRDFKNIERSLPDFEQLSKDDLQQFLDLKLESSYDFEEALHYEIMFLVQDNFNDVPAVVKKVEDFIAEKKGKMWRPNDWGLRRLAYKIKKVSKANYLPMNIEISSQAINELNTLLEKDERVIRHMCITQKEAITTASEPPPDYFPESETDDDDYDSQEEEEEEGEEEEEEGERVATRTV